MIRDLSLAYNPSIHTFEALQRQAGELCTVSGTLLAGSLGRMTIYENAGMDPEGEYSERGESLLVKPGGQTRDIDVLNLEGAPLTPQAPFPVDEDFFNLEELYFRRGDENEVTFQQGDGAAITLEPSIFEPIELNLGSATIRTVRPQTHEALLRLIGVKRKKDLIAIRHIAEARERLPDYEVPQAHYEPLEAISFNHRKIRVFLRTIYRERIPTPVRDLLTPLAQKI